MRPESIHPAFASGIGNAFATAKEAQDEMKALKDKLKADIDFAAVEAQ